MKYFLLVLCLVLPVTAEASFFEDDAPPLCVNGAGVSFETAFSPSGAISPLVVKELASAKKSIRMSARMFTSKPVSEALVRATRAKVDTKVVLNKKTNATPYSAAQFMLTMSVPPHVTKQEDALYSSFIVIDDRDIILGNIAGIIDEVEEKKDDASVLIIHNAPDLAKQYLAHWYKLWDASVEMKRD